MALFTNIAACNGRPAGYSGHEFDQTFPGGRRPLLVRLNSENLMVIPRRMNPKVEYRLQQIQRVNDSPSLAATFPRLKSLTVDLAYFEGDRLMKSGDLRYKVNVQHAKSLFSFVCPSGECIGGGFDLSMSVADAVAGRRKNVEGQIQCPGTRTKPKQQGTVPCQNLLHYKLSLGYV